MRIKRKKSEVYGEDAANDWTYQKWFEKYYAKDSGSTIFQLDWLVEIDSNQIKTLLGNNQHHVTCEITNIFKITKSSVNNCPPLNLWIFL